MKKSIFTLSVVALFIGQQVYAQTPWHTSGDSAMPGSFIGSTNNTSLLFKTNDSTRMRIDSNGVTHINSLVVSDSVIFTGPVSFTDPSGDMLRNLAGVIITPANDAVGATTQYFDVVGTNPVGPPTVLPLKGMGVNKPHPAYMLDVLCGDPLVLTKYDINVACPTCTPANSVGYRIGGNMVMWHDGDVSSFYLGVGAGFAAPVVKGQDNTFIGFNADGAFAGVNGANNTAVGYQCLTNNTANDNTGVGWHALFQNVTGVQNVAVGGNALQNNTVGGGAGANVAVGYNASATNSTGVSNVAMGWHTLEENKVSDNTAIGGQAMQHTNGALAADNTAVGQAAMWQNYLGSNNTGIGMWALYNNQNNAGGSGSFNAALGQGSLFNNYKDDNTASGYYSGYNITTGIANTADGYKSMFGAFIPGTPPIPICTGNYNAASGAVSLYNLSSGDSNSCAGAGSLFNITTGGENSALGLAAGANVAVAAGYKNTFLGTKADANALVSEATAVGYGAIVASTNQMELGANNVSVTIGRSTLPPISIPTKTNLEIATDNSPWPGWHGSQTTTNAYLGTGFTGLRFDDLTSNSTPVNRSSFGSTNPFPAGVLSVDGYGNVIYVPAPNPIGTGIGYCSAPCGSGTGLAAMAGSGGYDMSSNNFYFAGNGAGTAVNNVAIGNGCCYAPLAKLDVFQNSGSSSSIGVYINNTDVNPGCTSAPVMGLYSQVPNIPPGSPLINTTPNIAGFFNAPDYADGNACTCGAPMGNFALLVPAATYTLGIYQYGGYVGIGVPYPYNYTCPSPPYDASFIGNYFSALVTVNGSILAGSGTWTFSDSNLKKNITPLPNELQKIKSLRPITYQWKKTTDTISSGTHYGFIAQQVDTVFPNAVRHTTGGLYALSYTDIIPILTKALQQEDSTVIANKKTDSIIVSNQKLINDSLRSTLDSLRSAFQSYLICLNSLCDSSMRSLHHHIGGNGNSGDNIQDITLSGLADAPLLYQNIPNPFTVGTKINYYLPQGTMGASMVFYDNYGNQIKTVELSQTGNGTLNITPDNLTNGIYSYSLIVNGNVIDTKRMVLQK